MNLIIDIGNTSTKLAVFEKDNLKEIFYDSNQSLDSINKILKKYRIEKSIVSSVINDKEEIKKQIFNLPGKVLTLTHTTPIPIKNSYKTPATLGLDRIAAVVGASYIYPNKDILVIDAGTAITYELINAEGCYLGGNISPGIQMRFKALNAFTDRLPLINKDGIIPIMGYDTETAIRSGVIKGVELEILGYIHLIKNNYPDLLVFLTGGDEFSFDTNLKSIIFADRFLVLKGLNRILNYNDKI